LLQLLDGAGLPGKVGETLLLIVSGGEDWPRVAILSVGEVLAPSTSRLVLGLHSSSRTTEALRRSGRALLVAVCDGTVYKVSLTARLWGDRVLHGVGNTFFRAEIDEVSMDEVGYAKVTSGVTYELLLGKAEVLARWQASVELMSTID
jgi:hypothetical protein